MELRLLRYFLTVAKEQSFTKAAEQLHITQPTLSRQMAAFEEELGVTLFIRSGKKISLTEEGILLKRRALEILNLEEKTLEELKGKEDVVEGNITIGCGEFAAVELSLIHIYPLFGDVNQRKGGKRNNFSQTCKHKLAETVFTSISYS